MITALRALHELSVHYPSAGRGRLKVSSTACMTDQGSTRVQEFLAHRVESRSARNTAGATTGNDYNLVPVNVCLIPTAATTPGRMYGLDDEQRPTATAADRPGPHRTERFQGRDGYHACNRRVRWRHLSTDA